MTILQLPFVQGMIRMAHEGYTRGWHERNGGNLSYRLLPQEVAQTKDGFSPRDWEPIGASVPSLGGEYFLVSGTGRYMGNVLRTPASTLGLIELDQTGERYRVVWGLEEDGRPTSELPSHLMNHAVKKRASNGRHRVIYHAHPANVIALTFVLPLDDKTFTRELWSTMTECPVVFPDGVGVAPWMVPGGREIALATSRLMEDYDVAVWAHHGMFCSGENFDLTFGLMDTVEKSAEVLVKVLSMGGKRQSMTSDDLRAVARDFGLSLPERFLDPATGEQ